MGIFDGLGSVVSEVLAGQHVDFATVAGKIWENAGGLDGIVAQLNSSGLGDQVASWVGTGHNLPVSADQIKEALSSEQLRNIASSFGIDISQVPQLLAEHLPKAVDAATPSGVLPS